jgi:predicted nucleotidyltransferase
MAQTTLPFRDRFAELRQKIIPLLKPYAKRISVFGSFARGEETAESDIDLLVALKPSHLRPALGLFEVIRLEQELKKQLGREVDFVTEEGLNPRRKPFIEKDRVVLYEE